MSWKPITSTKITEPTINNWSPILPVKSSGLSLTNPNFNTANSTLAVPNSNTPNINPAGFAIDIIQGTARTVGSVGVTAGNEVAKLGNNFSQKIGLAPQPLPFDESIETQWSPITKAVFGGQPVQTIGKNISDLQTTLEPYIGKTGSNLTATPLVIGSIALDLTGFGGGKAVKLATNEIPEAFFKAMAKDVSPGNIEGILRKIGMDETLARSLAPKFARTKTIQEAKNVLLDFGKSTTETAPNLLKSPSAPEAVAKGMSKEEWIKGQGTPVYHGSPNEIVGGLNTSKNLGKGQHGDTFSGVFFTKDKNVAERYSKAPNKQALEKINNPAIANNTKQQQVKIKEINSEVDNLYSSFDRSGWVVDGDFNRFEKGLIGKPIMDKIQKLKKDLRTIKDNAPELTKQEKDLLYGKANVQESYVVGDIVKINKRVGFSENRESLIKQYKGKVIELTDGNGDIEIIATDPSQIKTRSQLSAQYDEAVNGVTPQVTNIAESIAQSKDSAQISQILHTTGVDKNQIPAMARVLVGIDNPKKVSTIIEGFDIKRTSKAPVKLPPQLEQRVIALEQKKMEIENSPLKPLEKLVVKRGNMKGSLPELSNEKFSRKMNTIVEENFGYGNKYAEDVRTEFEEKYLPAKAEIKKLEAELKQDIKNIKTEPSTPKQNIDLIQGEQGEVKSIEIQARQASSILEGEEIPKGVSLPKIISQTVTPIKQRVHLIDTYLRTPDRVMTKIGFGAEQKELRTAMDSYWKELPKNIEKIGQWAKEVPKESNQRIFKYLDGQAITLRPEEMKVATEIQSWLKEWANRLNLGKDNRISDYITHIFDKDFTEGKSFPEEIAKIIADKIPGTVYDPFTLKRLGAKGYLEDTWKALDAYVKRGTRKVHLDPVLEKIQSKAGSSLDLSNIEKSQWKYIKRYIDNINLRPSEADESIDNVVRSMFGDKFGQRPVTSITRFLRKATFRGMLGLNFSSAMRNLSQGINTYAVLGEKYTPIGYVNLLKKGAMSELEAQGILNAGFIQDKTLSAVGSAIEKVDKGLFLLFDTAEKINRGSAYFGAKAQGLARGYSEEKAIEYAKYIVRKTQFVFDSVDTPVGMQGDLMKTLFQFQSFTTKQIEFLTEMAKDKNFVGLLRYAIGGLLFTYTIGQAFGMKPKDILPWYRFETPASLKAPIETVKAVVDAPNKYGQDRSTGQKLKDVGNSLVGLIPGGSQIKKTVQGYNAMKQGKSTTASGVAQFDVGGTPAKDAQALLFGKYANDEAQSYFDGETYAEQKYNELLKSPTAKEDFDKILENDPNLARSILKVKEKIDLGITDDDEKLLKLNNQPRAEAIVKEFNDLETKEDKAKLWEEYTTKKIITEDVAEKLMELLAQPKKQSFNPISALFGAKTASAATEIPLQGVWRGTNYDPNDTAQNRPGAKPETIGIGAGGVKIDNTMVAVPRKKDGITGMLRLGTVIYIPSLDKKFLVADLKSSKYNGQKQIDFATTGISSQINPNLNKNFSGIVIVRQGNGRQDLREYVSSGEWAKELKNNQ